MPKQQTDAWRRRKRFPEGIRYFLKLASLPVVFAICMAFEYHGQSLFMSLGLFFQFAAFAASLLSFRSAKYGAIVHAVPYIVWIMGAALLISAPDVSDPIVASLIFLAVTVFTHGLIVYEARDDTRTKRMTKI